MKPPELSDLRGLLCSKDEVGFSDAIGQAITYEVLEYPLLYVSIARAAELWTEISAKKPRLLSHAFFLRPVLGERDICC